MTSNSIAPPPGDPLRKGAPGALELVRHFVNSRNVEQNTDALGSPADLEAWLREHRLIDRKTKVTAADAARARIVRESLRALLLRNNGVNCDCETAVLDDESARSRFAMAFDPNGSSALKPTAPGFDGALGTILAAVHTAIVAKTWSRLKACADDACLWAYYDSSKNGCSRWCSAEICGNRSKVRRYREKNAKKTALMPPFRGAALPPKDSPT